MVNKIPLIRRKTGQTRQTVLDEAHHDGETNTYIDNTAFETQSDWFQSLRVNPGVSIRAGRLVITVCAIFLSPKDGGEIMVNFSDHHPFEARMFSPMVPD